MTHPQISPFSDDALRRLCLAVGDTNSGLTGREIGIVFQQLALDDPDPKLTKWWRLYNALKARQTAAGSGDIVVEFLQHACEQSKRVSSWIGGLPQHQHWQAEVNRSLESSSYALDKEGRVRRSRITLRVPTINDDLGDFDTLFGLWTQVNDHELRVTFDFSRCWFLRQNAVAFLGGLARLIEYRGGTIQFDWASLHPDVGLNLAKNCFRDAFGDPTAIGTGHTIPYREDKESSKAGLMDYLKQRWLGRGWVNVSPALRDAIVGPVWEIYANAFEHSRSPVGVFSCGQHYPQKRLLKLAVVDFGVGIPSNVRWFVRDDRLATNIALQWAFQPGNTTKPNGMGRGMGLDLLKEFVRLNKGRLEVFSHDGYARIDEREERYETRQSMFEGTVLNISLQCDDRYYCFKSEVPDTPLF